MRTKPCVVVTMLIALIVTNGCASIFHGHRDDLSVRSDSPEAKIYVNGRYLADGFATTAVERGKEHEIRVVRPGCKDAVYKTTSSFDSVSLLGILLDFGIVSMLVVDWGATGNINKLDPASYTINPECPAATRATASELSPK